MSLACLEIRSRNDAAINSKHETGFYRYRFFYFLLYRRRYFLFVSKWPLCVIASDEQISQPSLVWKQNSSHLHSLCVGILFNCTALGIHLCKTSQLYILKTRLGGEIYSSDVNMHKGYWFSTRVSDNRKFVCGRRLYACINTRKFKGLDSREIKSLPGIKKVIYMGRHFNHHRK